MLRELHLAHALITPADADYTDKFESDAFPPQEFCDGHPRDRQE